MLLSACDGGSDDPVLAQGLDTPRRVENQSGFWLKPLFVLAIPCALTRARPPSAALLRLRGGFGWGRGWRE
jgi:hypothetical protein